MISIRSMAREIFDFLPLLIFILIFCIFIYTVIKIISKEIKFNSINKYLYGIFFNLTSKELVVLSCGIFTIVYYLYLIVFDYYVNNNYLLIVIILFILVSILTLDIRLFLRSILTNLLSIIIVLIVLSLKEYIFLISFTWTAFLVFILTVIFLIALQVMNFMFCINWMHKKKGTK